MKLKESLEKKRFVVTSEVQAPLDESPDQLVKSLELIRGRMDGVTIPEIQIEGIVSDTIKVCELLNENRFDAIYQTTTRDKNRIQLQKDLLRAHNSGVENLLVFTEDYRITGDSLQEMMFFHVDAGKLQSVLQHMREGRTVDGHEIGKATDFVVGSGVESGWGKDVPDLELKEMEALAEIGVGYFLSTPVFDVDQFARFLKQVDTFGIPVIAEVMILRTAGMARFLNRHIKSGMVPEWLIKKLAEAPDKEKASIEIFADTVKGLKDLCQGVHIITIGGEEKLRYYLDAATLR
ncbi:MAG: methylenetetrahydrofolate reductase [Deltaproteobacteria bacterium]|nr:methylenetetrahydrofolate reductase [Deltaproteobacteria bacterium]MBW1950906.1 methylenetetrahydrofolate reductase [Deltaproteobacteria bacterium]MBW2009361.1 methylenetetrahydrofolate reductase [Deltaproteobacteria bacterium]MBW2349476.1 methylenetetrahydrofolate reductase [Deltaproteobacteria bacterium]